MLVAVENRLVGGCGWEVPAGRGVSTEAQSQLLGTVTKQLLVKTIINLNTNVYYTTKA
jgi:hypothetical protein